MDAISERAARVPAHLMPRAVARGIDVVILAAVDGALGRLLGFGFDWLVLGAALVVTYFAMLDVWFGTTLGKLALGLQVIGPGGGRPTLREAWAREAFVLLGAIPFVGPPVAFVVWIWIMVTIRSSPLRQGPHDTLAGGTRVVQRAAA